MLMAEVVALTLDHYYEYIHMRSAMSRSGCADVAQLNAR